MPINAYTGLMGSGKSFEVVSQVIVKAISNGRRVVTNVDGIDGDAIRAYCHEKNKIDFERLGDVVHVTNDQVFTDEFFPDGESDVSIVKGGDLVAIDEAWRFWGTGEKISKRHMIFFREHRHYVHPDTKVSCDLVLMVQDINDLNRSLKTVVELSFRTEKKKSLGLHKVYSVSMYEGYKINTKARVGNWVRQYDPEVFPLYSSYQGGAGKEVQVDKRQNVLANRRLWFIVGLAVIGGSYSFYNVYRFFNPKPVVATKAATNEPAGASSSSSAVSPAVAHLPPTVSENWRISGVLQSGDRRFVVLMNPAGRVRLESPSVFRGVGLDMSGDIEGERVTTYGAFSVSAPASVSASEVKK